MYTYTYTYMNITTYIRKEDEHLWKAIPNKAEWLHAALNNIDYRVPPALDEPEYVEVPPAELKTKNIRSADAEVKLNVMDNDALKALLGTKAKPIKDEPRHVCPPTCKHWVWNVDKGGRINTLTGEFEEGEPW